MRIGNFYLENSFLKLEHKIFIFLTIVEILKFPKFNTHAENLTWDTIFDEFKAILCLIIKKEIQNSIYLEISTLIFYENIFLVYINLLFLRYAFVYFFKTKLIPHTHFINGIFLLSMFNIKHALIP